MKTREELLDHAANALDAPKEDLTLSDGQVVHKNADRGISYADVVKDKGSAIETVGLYDDTSKVADAACARRSPRWKWIRKPATSSSSG